MLEKRLNFLFTLRFVFDRNSEMGNTHHRY